MSTGKGGKAKRGPATEPAGSTDVASLCLAFLAERDPKSAASFTKLASLSVATPDECGIFLSTIGVACSAHPRNRAAAGPSVVRRVCGLMAEGLVTSKDATREWCQALVLLFGFHDADESIADPNVVALVSAGGFEMLISVLDRFVSQVDICLLIVECLEFLASTPAIELKLMSSGSLKRLYAAMSTHLHCARLQRSSCFAIKAHVPESIASARMTSHVACSTILGIPVKGDARDGIVFSGGLAHIYAAMDAHPASVDIQTEACRAMKTLASVDNPGRDSAINGLRIVTTCGLARIYAAMTAHPLSEDVHVSAAELLYAIALNSESKSAVVASGGLQHMNTSMTVHASSPSVLAALFPPLQIVCCDHPANRAALVSSGGLDLLCTAMARHSTSEVVQSRGIAVLCNISGSSDELDSKLVSSGALDRLLAAMAAHKASKDVQGAACATIRGLCRNRNPVVITRVVSGGGLGLICAAMRTHPTSEFLQEAACGALRNTASTVAGMVAVGSSGALEALYATMASLPACAEVQEAAMGALLNLANLPSNFAAMKAGRAAALIRKAIATHRTPLVRQEGPTLLARLTAGK